MPKTTHDLGLRTSIQNFNAFVRCTLMGNQPWPQFKNGIRERSIGNACNQYKCMKTRLKRTQRTFDQPKLQPKEIGHDPVYSFPINSWESMVIQVGIMSESREMYCNVV